HYRRLNRPGVCPTENAICRRAAEYNCVDEPPRSQCASGNQGCTLRSAGKPKACRDRGGCSHAHRLVAPGNPTWTTYDSRSRRVEATFLSDAAPYSTRCNAAFSPIPIVGVLNL